MKIVDLSCKKYRQITWSKDDTIETSTQVRAHNRRYAADCPKGASGE